MPKQNNSSKPQTNIKAENISGVSGNLNIAGGNITTHQTTTGFGESEIKQLFDQLYTIIDANTRISSANREDLKAEVNEIQSAVTEAAGKNEKLDENFVKRRFRNIARMAPDILDVVVATLGNPLAGWGVAVKKIAERAKEQTK